MLNLKILLGIAALAVAVIAGWQVAACELANMELQEEMHDLTSQLGARVGYSSPKSDEDFRDAVLRSAKQHGIELLPEQVSVQRESTEKMPILHLSADYTAPIHVFGLSFRIHFTPSSEKKVF